MLRDLLTRPAPKSTSKNVDRSSAKRQRMETLDDVISFVIERAVDRNASPDSNSAPTASSSDSLTATAAGQTNGEPSQKVVELVRFKRRIDAFKTVLTREALPPRIMVLCK